MRWEPHRNAGLERLKAFLPNAGRTYRTDRDTDYGPDRRDNVSALSPWIRHRLVIEREVAEAVLGAHKYKSAERFLDELAWRTYWKGWLEMRPRVWDAYRDAVDEEAGKLESDPAFAAAHAAAIEGRTGIEPFDHWIGELVDTGYLHNHARMWFASIWVYTLELPWELGADFFLRHLLDGDPASNTLSWRWVCGLHTPGKTYLARAENILKHADGRFQIRGDLLAPDAPPVEGFPNPDPAPIRVPDDPPDEPFAFLVHEDDLGPFERQLKRPPAGVGGLLLTDRRSPDLVGGPARAFAKGALADAFERAKRTWGVDARMLEATAEALVAWADELDVAAIATPEPPVGPVREVLDALEPGLDAEGIQLLRVRRDWDDAFWPHAARGYFAFKDRLRETLQALGVKGA